PVFATSEPARPMSYGRRYVPDSRNAYFESLPMMPLGNVVLLGSFRSAPCATPPRFSPTVKPATICQRFENRLLAVSSTPLYVVSRYGSLSRMLFCALARFEARLYTVTVDTPPALAGTGTVNAAYAVSGTAVFPWPTCLRLVR